MTERHPLLQDPHHETAAEWHPVEAAPPSDGVAISVSVGAAIEARDHIGVGSPEED